MDSYEIEGTSDWLGSPTELQTLKHYAGMLEEDLRSVRDQLRSAKETISGLVEMNDQLSIELKKARAWMANLETETSAQLAEIRSLSLVHDQNESLRRQLQAMDKAGAKGHL